MIIHYLYLCLMSRPRTACVCSDLSSTMTKVRFASTKRNTSLCRVVSSYPPCETLVRIVIIHDFFPQCDPVPFAFPARSRGRARGPRARPVECSDICSAHVRRSLRSGTRSRDRGITTRSGKDMQRTEHLDPLPAQFHTPCQRTVEGKEGRGGGTILDGRVWE